MLTLIGGGLAKIMLIVGLMTAPVAGITPATGAAVSVHDSVTGAGHAVDVTRIGPAHLDPAQIGVDVDGDGVTIDAGEVKVEVTSSQVHIVGGDFEVIANGEGVSIVAPGGWGVTVTGSGVSITGPDDALDDTSDDDEGTP